MSRPKLIILLTAILLFGFAWSACAQESDAASGGQTEINVKNADLGTIIKIFSKKTQRNYILDENVKGKVTIYLPGKVSDSESVKILEAILALKGFTSVPIGENIWKIVPAKDAKQSTIPTLKNERNDQATAAVVTHLVRLKYVSADDMQKLLSQLISPNGLINAYSRTNSLVIIDSEDNIERLLDIVESVDIPSSDQDMTIVPIKHADAQEIAETLKNILGDDAKGSADSSPIDVIRNRLNQINPDGKPVPVAAGGSNVSVAAKSSAAKIIADARTNSIILVADETDTARIKALISQLDSTVDLSGNRFYVYRCQHANAEELADVLGGLTGASGGSSSSSRSTSTDAFNNDATGLSRINSNSRSSRGNASLRSEQRLAANRRTPGRSRNENRPQNEVSSVSFSEELSITADPSTNSLVIAGSKADYEKILELLKQLDIKRRQVLVEAIIVEVGITDNDKLGVEFLTSTGGADGGVLVSNKGVDLSTLFSNPAQLSNFSIAAASSGTLTLPGGITIPTQAVLVSALQNNSNANVLSAPTILATDNESAEIVVGQNVPFIASTSTSTDNLNNTFNQIDRQDVGITLRLTPQISSGETVTMNIFTEVSNVIAATATSSVGPTTTLRTSETTVITKDGQMVAIGGLMSDDVSQAENGIPFLKDIPVLGYLFKVSSEDHRRTNLLIFITPHVVKDQYDARENTIIQRNKMADVMAGRNVGPDRAEVLLNPAIDNVAEYYEYKGEKPSTIIPPAKSKRIEQKPLAMNTAPLNTVPSLSNSSDEDPIELRVSPKLPSNTQQSASEKEPRGSIKHEIVPSEKATGVVVVLRNLGVSGPDNSAELPFIISKDSKLAGISMEGSSSSFFQAGSQYGYQIGSSSILFEALGVFSSKGQAQEVFPELASSWHSLSPYEMINLGKGPWIRTTH